MPLRRPSSPAWLAWPRFGALPPRIPIRPWFTTHGRTKLRTVRQHPHLLRRTALVRAAQCCNLPSQPGPTPAARSESSPSPRDNPRTKAPRPTAARSRLPSSGILCLLLLPERHALNSRLCGLFDRPAAIEPFLGSPPLAGRCIRTAQCGRTQDRTLEGPASHPR